MTCSVFFFFKQKTAYEMRISDWSSDVCSSDLLGSLNALAFDKTGTLTAGRPRITDIVPATGVDDDELMAIAVAVERLSDHPLAEAIARDGEQFLDEQPIPAATDMASLTGRGVKARVNGETVLIGKAEMFGRDGFAPLSDETARSEEHTSELQSLMRISYADFCLTKKND